MSDIVPAAAAPAASAAPAQQSVASPETPPSPPPFDSKKVASELFKVLTAGTPDPAEPTPPKKEEPKPADTAPKKPESATPAEKPIKVGKRKVPEETRPELPKKTERSAPSAATPLPAPTTPPQNDADFEKELVDEERALLEDARDAERYLGDKYKGHGAKMKAFLKEAAKKQDAVDKGEIDEAEVKEWYDKNRPKITALDFRAVERARVTADVKKDFEPKLEAERHARWSEAEAPKIKAKGDALYGKLINAALPDEVQSAIKERTAGLTDRAAIVKAVQAVEKDYALETEIAQNIVTAATADLEEFHRLTTVNPATGKSVAAFDPNNQQHNRLVQIVSDVCEGFKATGGAELKKDGKWFATRAEWSAMDAMVKDGTLPREELSKWWTFDNDQIVERALGGVKGVVDNAVTARRKELEEKYGFKRTIAARAAAPAATLPPAAGAPPAPRPSMIPPPAGSAAPSLGARLAATLTSQPAEN